jgi:hypothetical protein
VTGRISLRRAGPGMAVPVAAVVLAAVLAVVLASCGSPVAAGSRPGGQELRRALAAWSRFPAGASPRPLVLAGPDVTAPPAGFPSSADKLAYEAGAITFPPAMPPGPESAAGFRVITAGQAAALFRPGAVTGPPARTRLRVTTVRLGAATFVTDRGLRRLPAWLFSFAAVHGPAAVLAVAPAQIFPLPAPAGEQPPLVNWAFSRPGGRALTVRFTGAQAGHGPCTAGYSVQVAASATAVAVALVEHPHASGNVACSAVGYSRQVTTRLTEPLGARVVVDVVTRAPVPVTSGHSPS